MKDGIIFEGTFKNITIPSVNTRFSKDPRYYAHKDYLIGLFMEVSGITKAPYTGPVQVTIYMITKKDIDNSLKVIQDSLEAAGIIEDDKQIKKLIKCIVSTETEKVGKDSLYIKVQILEHGEFLRICKHSGLINI